MQNTKRNSNLKWHRQSLRKNEPKAIHPHDPTTHVFVKPAVKKTPTEIQWVKTEPKVDLKARKKKVYK